MSFILDSTDIYKCIAEPQRLRILNLLEAGPLCVCHLQELIEETQVKVSKQLATMKQLGLLSAERDGNWMIYRLSEPRDPLLLANLNFLRDADYPISQQLRRDLNARVTLSTTSAKLSAISCCT